MILMRFFVAPTKGSLREFFPKGTFFVLCALHIKRSTPLMQSRLKTVCIKGVFLFAARCRNTYPLSPLGHNRRVRNKLSSDVPVTAKNDVL